MREKTFRDPSLPFADSFVPYHFVIGYLEAREIVSTKKQQQK